jgi:hypothetical protein
MEKENLTKKYINWRRIRVNMAAKGAPKPNILYRLLVINSLDKLDDLKEMVSGAIVAAFGVLLCFGGYLVFAYAGMPLSAAIAILATYAYLAVMLYHFVRYKKDRREEIKKHYRLFSNTFELTISYVLLFILYLAVIEKALYVAFFFPETSVGSTFLAALPGLVVMALPLFVWEPLCDYTPVDEIIKTVFRGAKSGG